jgi:hypothetical protein
MTTFLLFILAPEDLKFLLQLPYAPLNVAFLLCVKEFKKSEKINLEISSSHTRPSTSPSCYVHVCACVCVCVCVRAPKLRLPAMCVCAHAFVRVCMRVCVCRRPRWFRV